MDGLIAPGFTDAEWLAWRAEKRKRRARQRRQVERNERDEQREMVAQAKHCLIEAYEAMRGHPDLPVMPSA